MASVFYVHWDEGEARERSAMLRKAGYHVRTHWKTNEPPKFRDASWPDIFVISLDRLPAHGRAIAEWVWASNARHAIPIVFAGGHPDKVKATRREFPGAHYCDTGEEIPAIERIFR